MGFAIVHMQKFKASGVRGIQSHNNREHDPKTNSDIDQERTKENYDLVGNKNYAKFIKDTVKNFATKTKTVRKDAVVMTSFLVTSDHETMKSMSFKQQREFFHDSVKWFAERYGKQNIVNATVHMDERTPHMHLGIVPITEDGRLSAKTLFHRKEMVSIQTDFVDDVGEKYGLKRGQEGSEATHLSEMRFKAATARTELSELEESIGDLKEEENSLESKLDGYEKLLCGANVLKYLNTLGKYNVPTKDGTGKVLCHAVPIATYESVEAQIENAGRVLKDAQQGHSLRMELARERSKIESLENEKATHEQILGKNPALKEIYQNAQREWDEERRVMYRRYMQQER